MKPEDYMSGLMSEYMEKGWEWTDSVSEHENISETSSNGLKADSFVIYEISK